MSFNTSDNTMKMDMWIHFWSDRTLRIVHVHALKMWFGRSDESPHLSAWGNEFQEDGSSDGDEV
jgi:hypothetical protein